MNVARYYVLSVEPTLFAKDTPVRAVANALGQAGPKNMGFFDGGSEAMLEGGINPRTSPATERTYPLGMVLSVCPDIVDYASHQELPIPRMMKRLEAGCSGRMLNC